MDDDFDSVAGNLKQRSTWLRILFMLGFGLALYVVGIVLLFVTVAQALFSILTGSDNRNLRLLGADLAEYVNQILRFLTYNSETRPFPLGPFPDQADAKAAPPEESKDAGGTPGGATESDAAAGLREAGAGDGMKTDTEVKKNTRIPAHPGDRSTAEQQQLKEGKTMSNQGHTSKSDNDGSADKASGEAIPSLADIKVNVTNSKKEVPKIFSSLQSGRVADKKGPATASEEAENQDK